MMTIDSVSAAVLAGDNTVIIGFFTMLGVIATAIGAPYAIRKSKSGKIDTTEAGELWKEAGSMRQALKEEVTALKEELASIKGENAAIKLENKDLRADNNLWRDRVDKMEEQMEELRTNESLLRSRIQDLEKAHG